MSRGGVLLVYNLLLPVALVAFLPGFLVKMIRRGSYGRGFMQRFSFYGDEVAQRLVGGCDVWIHAVSVGEVFVARKLIEKLRGQMPGARFVLSTTTSTGYAQARELQGDGLSVIYNPLDFPWIVGRALRVIAPKTIVLVEAEVWPNLLTRATRMGIPVALASARLSPRSEARFRRFASMVRPVFEQLDAIMVSFDEDVERWEALGVPGERISMVGSIKFDQEVERTPRGDGQFERILGEIAGEPSPGDAGKRPVLVLGSTHKGEEKLLGQVYLDLRREFPDLLLVVVPRHFERAAEVSEDLRSLGLEPVLRSTCRGAGPGEEQEKVRGKLIGSAVRCLLVDTTGELMDWYHHASLVVIGKSFLEEGGQNPAEPVIAGAPVFFGPKMSNFSQLVKQLKRNGGAVQVWNSEELREKLAQYLREPAEGAELVQHAREVLKGHQGATERTAQIVARKAGRPGGAGQVEGS